jgi:hypothetical protein
MKMSRRDGRNVRLNPPYHKDQVDLWVRKAYDESRNGAIVVALLPARTSIRKTK